MGTTASIITAEGEVETGLIKVDSIVKPAVSAEGAIEAWNAYQNLKKQVLVEEDFQDIQGKQYPKKSAWRKLATFFNLSVDLVKEAEIKNEDGTLDFDVTYRATAPNGRSVIGDGSCNSHEKGRVNSRHNTRGTAHTRAFNRCVSNLIGGGEVSAEELNDDEREERSHSKSNAAAAPAKSDGTIYDSNYGITFGMYANRKIGDVPLKELESYIAKLESGDKPLSGKALDLKKMIELRKHAEQAGHSPREYEAIPF